MSKKKGLSEEDKKTWETYIKNPSDLFDKEKDISQNKKRKDRFKYDLHGYSLEEAKQKVKEIIISCVNNNYREILFITGKGLHSTSDRNLFVSKKLSKLKYSFILFKVTTSSTNLLFQFQTQIEWMEEKELFLLSLNL